MPECLRLVCQIDLFLSCFQVCVIFWVSGDEYACSCVLCTRPYLTNVRMFIAGIMTLEVCQVYELISDLFDDNRSH